MTTIVAINTKEEKAIYADSRLSAGNHIISENDVKLAKVDTPTGVVLVGYCGRADMQDPFITALMSGDEFDFKHLDMGEAVVLREKGKIVVFTGEGYFTVNDEVYTAGSGGQYAMSAIKLGKSPRDAIKHASTLDMCTNSKVKKVSFEPKKRKVKESLSKFSKTVEELVNKQ